MLGFKIMPSKQHPLTVELAEHRVQRRLGYPGALLQGVVAVHEHLGLDYGHQTGFLTQGGITRQGVGVGFETSTAGNALADGDHRPPFGKPGPHLPVFRQALPQAIQAFGNFLPRMTGHIFGAGVYLNARNNSSLSQKLDKRGAVIVWPDVWSRHIKWPR